MAPHSSTLAWKIPWMEEPGRLQSMGLLSVGHDWATSLSLFTVMHRRKEMATHSSVLAWRIPGTGEPGGLLSMGSHRVGHDWSDLAAAVAQYMIANYWYSAVQQLSKIYLSSVTENLYPLNNNFPFPFPSSPWHIHFYSSFSFPCPLSYFVIIYFICDFFLVCLLHCTGSPWEDRKNLPYFPCKQCSSL